MSSKVAGKEGMLSPIRPLPAAEPGARGEGEGNCAAQGLHPWAAGAGLGARAGRGRVPNPRFDAAPLRLLGSMNKYLIWTFS